MTPVSEDRPPPNPPWFGGGDMVPVPEPDVCVADGYEYRAHEPWPFMYECSRCGKRLDDGE